MKKYSRWFLLIMLACLPPVYVHADSNEDVVHWSALRELDEAAEKADALGDASDERWRGAATELNNAARAVLTNSIPADVRNRKMVEQHLRDLSDLASLVSEPEKMNLEEMKMASEAFHPLVVSIMEEAGVPHVHEHGHDHDHDEAHDECHDDHDHHHDHDHHKEGSHE